MGVPATDVSPCRLTGPDGVEVLGMYDTDGMQRPTGKKSES